MFHDDSDVGGSRRLLVFGTVLFFLGLVNGVLVSAFPNHQQAVSAHVTGLQDGAVLWAFGLMWHRVRLSVRLRAVVGAASIYSMYAIWSGLALAACATHDSSAAAHTGFLRVAVGTLEATGSLAILAACLEVLIGLCATVPAVSQQSVIVGQSRAAVSR